MLPSLEDDLGGVNSLKGKDIPEGDNIEETPKKGHATSKGDL